MVLDPIPQSLPVHFFGSRPQPPTSRDMHTYFILICVLVYIYIYIYTLNICGIELVSSTLCIYMWHWDICMCVIELMSPDLWCMISYKLSSEMCACMWLLARCLLAGVSEIFVRVYVYVCVVVCVCASVYTIVCVNVCTCMRKYHIKFDILCKYTWACMCANISLVCCQ